MTIKINIPALWWYLTSDVRVVYVIGYTVSECLNSLIGQYPQLEEFLFDRRHELLGYIEIFLNGESTYPKEMTREVNDGDELNISSVIAGG